MPFTVVIAPEDATLTAPPPVANEVLQNQMLKQVSVTSNVPPAVVVAEPPVASVALDDVLML